MTQPAAQQVFDPGRQGKGRDETFESEEPGPALGAPPAGSAEMPTQIPPGHRFPRVEGRPRMWALGVSFQPQG